MTIIRIYNDISYEVMEKSFIDELDADERENILEFLGVRYERWYNGERLY